MIPKDDHNILQAKIKIKIENFHFHRIIWAQDNLNANSHKF